MTKLAWDRVGERRYETGVDHGVLYIPNVSGVYNLGYAWNGLVSVTESPSGAEASPQYADNIKYLNLLSTEEFGATIEAFTYPDEFAQCDGSAEPYDGVMVGQQSRKTFGLSYRTRVGNDLSGVDYGYKLHLIYGALAAPSEKAFTTINDSPEALTFSWELTTTPVEATGFKPTASITVDSTKVSPTALAQLEDALHGTAGTEPRLPLPAEVLAMFAAATVTVTPTQPAYNNVSKVITIPTVAGVTYSINGVDKPAGNVTITEDTVVEARPNAGYRFPPATDDDWFYDF